MVRGTPAGLEFVFEDDAFEETTARIMTRLDERPEFYRGSRAAAIFAGALPGDEPFARFVRSLEHRGIELRGLHGPPDARELAARIALPYLGEPPRPSVAQFERRRSARSERRVDFTSAARSLEADFAGARADIASRRARGEHSVARPNFEALPARNGAGGESGGAADAAVRQMRAAAAGAPATLYHRGSLRGGRSLQQLGSIVVVGNVNPGAELVATGDIVVFGALRGTAHAGAQGDVSARIYALELAPTQLRIATFIAAGGTEPRSGPQAAFVRDERIALVPVAEAEFER